MPIRNDLWHWRYLSTTQAATAYHQIAQAIQQPIVNIVSGDRSHDSSPISEQQFWHLGGVLASHQRNNAQKC
jgi:hypothetical protein